ncbi:CHAT domain-containing protein [Modestobacter marinus]|uniref:CHAT domain-containing protein n=1 Tax=Modestobacter marinus TaxID=477641 RepID=A0A846LQT6_9ACTN|nr:CHAT domain-containing protein [Modestobacter marinus]NIH68632.1 tetratricopeptide (TPR) repeat protein [Modestobacter marinus]GGL58833.1 CHAT domain-containing protein [Modestobacter marinus]
MGAAEDRREATAALSLVQVDPRRAGQLAAALLDRARARGDHATAAVAGRAAGLAALHTADLDTAAQHLRGSVRSARLAGSPQLAGEARMSLAAVLLRRGEGRAGLRTLDGALTELSGVEHARALAQRGSLHQQLGRLDAALADYRLALPALRRAGDWVWVQRVHGNVAVLDVYRSQLTAAAAELREAEQVCLRHGLDLDLAFVCDNLGFLHLRRGDVPAALHWQAEAERRLGHLGAPVGTVLVDRCELLLSLRLVTEAKEHATRAIEEFRRLHREISVPEAQLLLAEASLLDRDLAGAESAARAALHAFTRQRRPERAALARYVVQRCRLARAGGQVSVAELARTAARLDDAGWTAQAQDARISAARLALARGRVGRAEELLRTVAPGHRRGPVELRARAWHARALLELAAGRRAPALAALRTGVRLVEEHQATLGAADLRTSASVHRTELVDLGLHEALAGGRPRQVLAWAERGRATALLMRPVRPPEDPDLAQLLAELRATAHAVQEHRGDPRVLDGLTRRQGALERAVRDHVRAAGGGTRTQHRPGPDRLAAALGEAALVEFVEHRGQLAAVTLADGRARLTRLGSTDAVRELSQHVPHALRRLSRHSGTALREARDAAALTVLRETAGELDERLLRALPAQVAGRPLVVVPTPSLQSVNWPSLPSCAGRAVTVSPSAALWYRAATAPPRHGGVLVAAGPGLPAAPAEAAAVAELHPTATLLVGPGATVASVRAGIGRSAVAHVAAHGHLRADNPLFSSLQLSDGPLTVYDLDSLAEVPRLVVLAACDGGSSAVCAGAELLGLAAGFLTLGTSALIAPIGPVCDGAVADLMVELHGHLRDGLLPAAALARVQQDAAGGSPGTLAAAAGLLCLGAGTSPSSLPRAVSGGPAAGGDGTPRAGVTPVAAGA